MTPDRLLDRLISLSAAHDYGAALQGANKTWTGIPRRQLVQTDASEREIGNLLQHLRREKRWITMQYYPSYGWVPTAAGVARWQRWRKEQSSE